MKVNVKGLLNTAKKGVVKHSPEILIGIGVTSLVMATVTAVKATPKALNLIETAKREKKQNGEEPTLSKGEVIKKTWKCYVPSAISIVAGTACIIGAHTVHTKRSAALATACKLTEKAFEEFKEATVETVTEKKLGEIKEKVAEKKLENGPRTEEEAHVIITGKGNTLCYDSITGRYFRSSKEAIREAVNDLNDQLNNEDYAPLNDLYYCINLEETKIGDYLGWNRSYDGLLDVEFASKISPWGEPCLVMDYRIYPKYDYSESYR